MSESLKHGASSSQAGVATVASVHRGLPKAFLRRLRADQSGSVTLIFAVSFIPLIAITGLAIDFGRVYSVRSQTQSALDEAALAAGRVAQLSTTNKVTLASAAATAYFNQSAPKDVVSSTIQFSPNSNNTQFTVTATTWVRTPFLSTLNAIMQRPPNPGAPAGCQASLYSCAMQTNTATALLKVGGNALNSIEVALMLDTTGSMLDDDGTGHSKISTLKTAATNLVNTVVWQDQSQYTSKIAIIPFSEGVNVGNTYAAKARGAPAATFKFTDWGGSKHTYKLSTCVTERTGANAYTDAAPGAGTYVGAEYTSSGSCPESQQILPLTNSIPTFTTLISNLQASNSTAGHIGTAWAWYSISPNWGTVWPAASQPAAYGTAKLQKIAILMTDGMYNTQYCKGVRDDTINCSSPNGVSKDQALSLCGAMKAKGIIVYTVGFRFDASEAAVASATLSQCATDSNHYYNATDGNALQAAFADIALKISTLRLTN